MPLDGGFAVTGNAMSAQRSASPDEERTGTGMSPTTGTAFARFKFGDSGLSGEEAVEQKAISTPQPQSIQPTRAPGRGRRPSSHAGSTEPRGSVYERPLVSGPRAPPGPPGGRRRTSRSPSQGRNSPSSRRQSVDSLCFRADGDSCESTPGTPTSDQPTGRVRGISFLEAVRLALKTDAGEGRHMKVSKWHIARARLRTLRSDRITQIAEGLGISTRVAGKVFDWVGRAKWYAVSRRYYALRDAMLADAQKAGVKTELTTHERESGVNYREQGAAHLVEPEVLKLRSALRTHKKVQDAIRNIWESMAHCPPPHDDKIDRQIYQWMALKILNGLLPKRHQQGLCVRQTVDEEWWVESQGNYFMDYEIFFSSIFDFLDVWAESTKAEEYAALAEGVRQTLINHNDFVYSAKLATRHYKEWVARKDRQRSTELAPEEFPFSESAMRQHVRLRRQSAAREAAEREAVTRTSRERIPSGPISPQSNGSETSSPAAVAGPRGRRESRQPGWGTGRDSPVSGAPRADSGARRPSSPSRARAGSFASNASRGSSPDKRVDSFASNASGASRGSAEPLQPVQPSVAGPRGRPPIITPPGSRRNSPARSEEGGGGGSGGGGGGARRTSMSSQSSGSGGSNPAEGMGGRRLSTASDPAPQLTPEERTERDAKRAAAQREKDEKERKEMQKRLQMDREGQENRDRERRFQEARVEKLQAERFKQSNARGKEKEEARQKEADAAKSRQEQAEAKLQEANRRREEARREAAARREERRSQMQQRRVSTASDPASPSSGTSATRSPGRGKGRRDTAGSRTPRARHLRVLAETSEAGDDTELRSAPPSPEGSQEGTPKGTPRDGVDLSQASSPTRGVTCPQDKGQLPAAAEDTKDDVTQKHGALPPLPEPPSTPEGHPSPPPGTPPLLPQRSRSPRASGTSPRPMVGTPQTSSSPRPTVPAALQVQPPSPRAQAIAKQLAPIRSTSPHAAPISPSSSDGRRRTLPSNLSDMQFSTAAAAGSVHRDSVARVDSLPSSRAESPADGPPLMKVSGGRRAYSSPSVDVAPLTAVDDGLLHVPGKAIDLTSPQKGGRRQRPPDTPSTQPQTPRTGASDMEVEPALSGVPDLPRETSLNSGPDSQNPGSGLEGLARAADSLEDRLGKEAGLAAALRTGPAPGLARGTPTNAVRMARQGSCGSDSPMPSPGAVPRSPGGRPLPPLAVAGDAISSAKARVV